MVGKITFTSQNNVLAFFKGKTILGTQNPEDDGWARIVPTRKPLFLLQLRINGFTELRQRYRADQLAVDRKGGSAANSQPFALFKIGKPPSPYGRHSPSICQTARYPVFLSFYYFSIDIMLKTC